MTADSFRAAYDSVLHYSKELMSRLPPKGQQEKALAAPLRVCNGLDVVQRTVLDHMRGWSDGDSPMLPLGQHPKLDAAASQQDIASTERFGPLDLGCTYGCPSVTAAALKSGGIPETTDEKEAALLSTQRLFLLTLHYQGETKAYMSYDICRTLYATGGGSAAIRDPMVVKICSKSLSTNGGGADATSHDIVLSGQEAGREVDTGGNTNATWPCLPHELYGSAKPSTACF